MLESHSYTLYSFCEEACLQPRPNLRPFSGAEYNQFSGLQTAIVLQGNQTMGHHKICDFGIRIILT